MSLSSLLAAVETGKQPVFWALADVVIAVLLALNLLLFAFVHLRRLRVRRRRRRTTRFRARFERLLEEQGPGKAPDDDALRRQISRYNELERPIAAAILNERLRTGTPQERELTLAWMRKIGAIDVLLRSLRRWRPWRRALAIRMIGLAGADELVTALLERLGDRSRYVREATVRALGRIGDTRALPALADLYAHPGSVSPGLVYEALLAYGEPSAQIFSEGTYSHDEYVRVASVYGIGSVLDAERARSRLEQVLTDESASVRAAAAETLGRLGGDVVTEGLARASRDEQRSVRRAAVTALGSYDDPQALQLAVNALADPDRDTAVRAGETIVRLSRLQFVGAEADAVIGDAQEWPVERARILASLGGV